MNEIIELLKDSKNDDKLEQALILSYNASNSLPLYLVPHRFRNKGFFYNECLRKHQYDLIPNLTSEEIKTLKKELLEKSNALNRVDASAFNIKRVKADIYYLRAYLFQLMNDDFGLSKSCGDKFKTLNKKIEELSENEIFEIVPFEIQVDPRGIPINDRYYLELYHFNHESIADRNDFTNYPELFTDIKQVSFDQGGLIVFGLYGAEIFKLFTSKGKLISMPCDDLEILINGKFRKTYSGDSLDFNLLKYSLLTDSVININSFSDFGSGAFEFLSIYNRDSLQIEIGKTVPERIENFKKPKSKNEAKLILLDENCNWITSPELSKFYENDKELALLAVSREPIAFSLLSKDLMFDESIQKVLCLSANWDLLYYIKEWNLSIENILTLEELCEVIKKNGKLLSVLSNKIRLNRDCVIAAISNDSSNLKYADESLKKDMKFALELVKLNGRVLNYIDDSLKSDKQIVLAAVQESVYAIKFCSDSLLADEEFICEAYKRNPDIISYLDPKTINQHKSLRELNDDYKSTNVESLLADGKNESLMNEIEVNINNDGNDESTIDLTNARDEEVLRAFQFMGSVDNIVVIKDDKGNTHLKDEETGNEYMIVSEGKATLMPQTDDDLSYNDYEDFYYEEPKLKYLSAELQNDKKVVLKAVKRDGMALEFASVALQNDKEVVLLAIKRNVNAIKFASLVLQNDKEVLLELIKEYYWLLEYSFGFDDDGKLFFEDSKKNDEAFRFALVALQNNKEVLLMAIKNAGWLLQFASESLKSDIEIVLEAVKSDVSALEYASESLKSYREFMLVMVKSNGSALQYASESLKSDPEVVIEAIKNDYHAFQYCSELLRNDVDFICEAYKLNLNIMYYIDATKINHHKRLQELFDDYKSREEEQEERDDLPF